MSRTLRPWAISLYGVRDGRFYRSYRKAEAEAASRNRSRAVFGLPGTWEVVAR
jgi:hypothetical protein